MAGSSLMALTTPSAAHLPILPVALVAQAGASGAPANGAASEPSAAAPPERLNPTNRDIMLSAPLRDGAFLLGEVPFVLTKDDHILVNAPRLLAALQPVIAPGRYEALATALGAAADVPVEQIASLGFVISYDSQAIALTVDIPPEARNARQIRLAQLGSDLVGDVDKPAGVSAYVNLRGSFGYQWMGSDRGFQDPLIETDWAARVAGVVFEGEGTVQVGAGNGGPTQFRREGSRLVYDDNKLLARFTLGDLQPASRGFSGSSQIAGLSMTRTYSVLQPQRNVQPRGDRTFTLARASMVEAFINGQPVRQVRLEPGTYNVRDFPFVQGANDVRLLITDDTGRQESVSFSLFFDRTLLEPGLTEFGIYAGVLAPFAGNGRDYQISSPAANGYIRHGFSQTFTGGANFHARSNGAVVGTEVVWASPLGTIGFDLAASHVKRIGSGFAVNVGLQRTFGGTGSSGKSLALTFETRTKDFAIPGDLSPDNRYLFEVGATYSQAIGELQFVSIDGRYSKGRGSFGDEKSARLSYGYRLSSRLNLQAEGIYQQRNTFGSDYGLRLNLTYRMGERSSANAEFDSRSERGRVGYQTSTGSGVGATSISGNVDYGQGAVGLDGAVSYTANRAELSLAHSTAFDNGGFNVTDQRTSLRVGTALVLADGHVGLSRPVYDSFALVVPHKSLKGTSVEVEPREGEYSSRSGVLGGAVANDLSSYSDRVVTFDAPKAPAGYDLGAGNVRVYPPYKSGYLVVVGSDYSMTAIGRLLDDDGQPISLLAGLAYEVGKADKPPLTIFTNRAGRFGLSGLRPGQWRIEMPTEPRSQIIISIPDKSEAIVKLGDVTLKGTP
ncbi:MAG: fimbria/pilus outer membrane usher protein [Sphingobium limneticum]